MPKLTIDNREVSVPPGTKIIEAAARLGIIIPRFCYHPGLGSVGACRVCAVKIIEGPPRTTGIQMSCMLGAQDGMIVSTTDAEAVDFRKHIIEFLMLNHPHDCPVCDEGGHCLLQDMTVAGGHGIRRFRGKKRTHRDQYLGPLVQHEMNRCIQCYRCVRFYREFTGYTDLGVMGIGSRVYYGRCREGVLESPFAGNLVDICPTGVFTDKPSRYKGRRWDFERAPSICIHCSLGCHTVVCSRYREVVRQEARFSSAVNGYFICDRGRHGFHYASAPDRPRSAMIDRTEAAMETAIEAAQNRLAHVVESHGSGSVACIGSLRSSLESQGALKAVSGSLGWRNPAFFKDTREAAGVSAAASGIGRGTAVSMQEIARADLIVVLGADPINEAPMAALAMRQAARLGASVIVLDPRPVSLPMDFSHVPLAPDQIGPVVAAAAGLNDAAPSEASGDAHEDAVEALRQALAESLRPVIICGTDIVPPELAEIAASGTARLKDAGKTAGLFYLLPGPNALGALLFTAEAHALDAVVEDIEAGRIRGLVVVENDIFHHYPDHARLEKALKSLDALVVVDYLNQPLLGRADVFLPSATVYEAGGIFVNQEGRAQQMAPAFRGGIPLSQITGGSHPPREFTPAVPGGDPAPAWSVLARLAGAKPVTPASLGELYPALSTLDTCRPFPVEGVPIGKTLGLASRITPPAQAGTTGTEEGFALIMADQTFGTEALSIHSPCLREVEPAPFAVMHAADAAAAGLSDGDTLVIEGASESLAIPLRTARNMAPGVLVIPRHHRIRRQVLREEAGMIGKKRIKKS